MKVALNNPNKIKEIDLMEQVLANGVSSWKFIRIF